MSIAFKEWNIEGDSQLKFVYKCDIWWCAKVLWEINYCSISPTWSVPPVSGWVCKEDSGRPILILMLSKKYFALWSDLLRERFLSKKSQFKAHVSHFRFFFLRNLTPTLTPLLRRERIPKQGTIHRIFGPSCFCQIYFLRKST